jgi:nudix-type nucleoside diphosphatase (YffH/AdpP family)
VSTDDRERELYAGRILTLRLKYLRQPDGSTRLREIVEHAPGAAVVAVDADGQVLLVRQSRPAVGTDLLELPAGLVDTGETPLDCARRELAEETGFTADHLQPLTRFYSSPGFCTELLHIFVATDLRPAPTAHDEEEDIELVRLPLGVAIDQVLDGEISDAKTVAGLLAYWRRATEYPSAARP